MFDERKEVSEIHELELDEGIFKNNTDKGHSERAFIQKFETFGLGQTNWAEIFGGILAISSQIIGTILVL